MRQHRSLTFNEWLEHCFGHEVRMHGNPWYFDPDTPYWDPPADEALSHLVGLFENPVSALENYADSQISQGLTYLVNTMASGDCGWFYSGSPGGLERVIQTAEIEALQNATRSRSVELEVHSGHDRPDRASRVMKAKASGAAALDVLTAHNRRLNARSVTRSPRRRAAGPTKD